MLIRDMTRSEVVEALREFNDVGQYDFQPIEALRRKLARFRLGERGLTDDQADALIATETRRLVDCFNWDAIPLNRKAAK